MAFSRRDRRGSWCRVSLAPLNPAFATWPVRCLAVSPTLVPELHRSGFAGWSSIVPMRLSLMLASRMPHQARGALWGGGIRALGKKC